MMECGIGCVGFKLWVDFFDILSKFSGFVTLILMLDSVINFYSKINYFSE